MFCKFCGKEIRDDSKFCSVCGRNISGSDLEKTIEKSQIVTTQRASKKSAGAICGLIVLVLIAVACIGKGGSIEGKWYIVSELSSENPPAKEFNFMEGGKFIRDESVGGSYGADNGELLLQYNALAGSRSFEYEIKGGKLYLYTSNKVFVYSRIEN